MSRRARAADRARMQGKTRAAGATSLPVRSPRDTTPVAKAKRATCLVIEGVIGAAKNGATAASVRDFISIHGDGDLDVELNSEGGVITEGIAMYSALRRHPGNVTIRVTGLAASMGSIVLQAGDKRIISPGAYVMIHLPSTGAEGESSDLRGAADLLDKMRDDMLDIYEARTKQPREKLSKMMAEETWLNAEEALALGFVDEIDAKAQTLLRAVAQTYKRAPAAVVAASNQPGTGPAARKSAMTEDEEKELRAEVAALKAKLSAKAEDDSDDESEEKEETEEEAKAEDDKDEKKDQDAAQAAEVAAFVARGFIAPGAKAEALKMRPGAWDKHKATLLKLGPLVPTGQIKPPQGKIPTPGSESDDNEPAAATETEKAYMKASGKSLEEVRALAKVPKSQATQVVMSLATRKAV
jgi:ATP-dependent Clp endopeptidase proteolytic subunit ClpP